MRNDLSHANENIKLMIKYKGWTQAILCKKTGITDITLKRRLSSKIPKWSMLEAVSISNAFGLSVNDIFFTRMVPKGNNEANVKNQEAS